MKTVIQTMTAHVDLMADTEVRENLIQVEGSQEGQSSDHPVNVRADMISEGSEGVGNGAVVPHLNAHKVCCCHDWSYCISETW